MTTRRNKGLNALLILSLFIQALIPVGFMPSSLAEGHWVQLCPQQQPALYESLQLDDHQHAHHHHHGSSEQAPSVTGAACDWAGFSVNLDVIPERNLQWFTLSLERHTFQSQVSTPSVRSKTLASIRAPPYLA